MEEKDTLIGTVLYYGAIVVVLVFIVLFVGWVLPMGIEKLNAYYNPEQEIVEERFTKEYGGTLIVYHDTELNVTCYSSGMGLSCIPDAEIGRS